MTESGSAPGLGVEVLLEAAGLRLPASRIAAVGDAQRALAASARDVAAVVAALPASVPFVVATGPAHGR